jgi:uncharacterized membrane protein (DUF2068 family)
VSENLASRPRALGVLRLIAVFKFLKAMAVIATALGLLSFYQPEFAAALDRFVGHLPYDFEQRLLRKAIAFLSGMSPRRIQIIAAAAFAYAALFTIEGVGLWLGRHWGQLLTVIATSSLIPVEIFECARKFTPGNVLVLAANLAIVAYLVWLLRRQAAARVLAPAPRTH